MAGADNLSVIRMVLTLELEQGSGSGDPGRTRFGPGAIAGKQSGEPVRRTSGAEELGNLTCMLCPTFLGKRRVRKDSTDLNLHFSSDF